ncbi:MAG: tetratricopeptide repeat protein [Patiriisocius sp.]
MIKLLFFTILLFSLNVIYGQSIEEMEYDISWSKSGSFDEKIDTARKLQRIDIFNERAIDYILTYYFESRIDSVSIFLNELAEDFPNKKEPYLLKAQYQYYLNYGNDNLNFTQAKVELFKTALRVEPNSRETLYLIAKEYYRDFLIPFYKSQKIDFEELDLILYDENNNPVKPKAVPIITKSFLKSPGDSALVYFNKLWKVDISKRDLIYFPIKQLECYLDKKVSSQIPVNAVDDFNNCYFPSWYFADLKSNWECDFTINYLSEIELSNMYSGFIEEQLIGLKEDCIYDIFLNSNEEKYRFTWLRSFHNPISIRIEREGIDKFVYWKVGKGAAGYTPEGLMNSGKKELSKREWKKFLRLFKKMHFYDLDNQHVVPTTDGATWTFERKDEHNYKAHTTNSPSKHFVKIRNYLLELSEIVINDRDKY